MVHTDHFYGYLINFTFILIGLTGRELSKSFLFKDLSKKKLLHASIANTI